MFQEGFSLMIRLEQELLPVSSTVISFFVGNAHVKDT